MRATTLISAALLLVTGCSSETIVNTGEWATITSSTTPGPPPLPPTNPTHLANAFDFVQSPDGQAAYYFSTPSGRWRCAIRPGNQAACGAAGGALGIAGAPATVPDAAGEQTQPNAVVIGPQGDPYFAALDAAQLAPPAAATVLPFNRTLIVARFRCNIQEATGVACLSEDSGAGFTFSPQGFVPHYAEVPLDAP